eukprot:scaffold993_cov393-Prasinococcus_capsulatus_cf.AAC.9
MAATMATLGGIGFVHYNNTVEEQVEHVKRARAHRYFVTEATTLAPTSTIAEVEYLEDTRGITTVIVTEDGSNTGTVVGIVTKEDTEFVDDRSTLLSEVMTSDLVSVRSDASDDGTCY